MGADIDPGNPGCLRIGANGIGEFAIAGIAERDMEDHRNRQEDQPRPRKAGDLKAAPDPDELRCQQAYEQAGRIPFPMLPRLCVRGVEDGR